MDIGVQRGMIAIFSAIGTIYYIFKNFMKRIILLFLIFLSTVVQLHSTGKGQASGQFLNIDIGSRETSMGGAFTAQSGDINSLYYNPSGLADMKFKQLFFMNNSYFYDFKQNYLGYGTAVKFQGIRLGAAVNYFSYGNYNKTLMNTDNFEPIQNGIDDANAWSFAFGAAKKIFQNINTGASIKIIQIDLGAYSKLAYAADLGMQYKKVFDNFDLGFAVTNIGNKIKFIKVKEALPITFKLGSAYSLNDLILPNDALTAALDIKKPYKENIELAAGLEYKLFNAFSLRAGYNNAADEGSNISYGFGFIIKSWDFDYSYNPYGELGNSSRLSLMYKFGNYLPPHKYLVFKNKSNDIFSGDNLEFDEWEKNIIKLMGNDIVGILAYNNNYYEILNLYNKPNILRMTPIDNLGLGFAQYKIAVTPLTPFYAYKALIEGYRDNIDVKILYMSSLLKAGYLDMLIDYTSRSLLKGEEEHIPVYYYFKAYALYLKNKTLEYNAILNILSAEYPQSAKKLWLAIHNFESRKKSE